MVWTAAGPATARLLHGPLRGLKDASNLRGRKEEKRPHPKPYTDEELQTLAEWAAAPRDLGLVWGYPCQIPEHDPEDANRWVWKDGPTLKYQITLRRDRHHPLSGFVHCLSLKEPPDSAWWKFTKPRDQARDLEQRIGWGQEMRLCDRIDERRGDDPCPQRPQPKFNPPELPLTKPRPVTEGDKLIRAHFHVAWWAAWKYNRRDVDNFDDAQHRFQEACIGLFRAQKAFSIYFGTTFQQSAWTPCSNAVLDYLKRQQRIRRGDLDAEEYCERIEEYNWITLFQKDEPQLVKRRVRHRIKKIYPQRKTKNEDSTNQRSNSLEDGQLARRQRHA
jgi:DNA-directed RNA polymerase specialized sigma24 family protein